MTWAVTSLSDFGSAWTTGRTMYCRAYPPTSHHQKHWTLKLTFLHLKLPVCRHDYKGIHWPNYSKTLPGDGITFWVQKQGVMCVCACVCLCTCVHDQPVANYQTIIHRQKPPNQLSNVSPIYEILQVIGLHHRGVIIGVSTGWYIMMIIMNHSWPTDP